MSDAPRFRHPVYKALRRKAKRYFAQRCRAAARNPAERAGGDGIPRDRIVHRKCALLPKHVPSNTLANRKDMFRFALSLRISAQNYARLLAINFADDELNPPQLGTMEPAIARIPGARYVLVPASAETNGHYPTLLAALRAPASVRFSGMMPVNRSRYGDVPACRRKYCRHGWQNRVLPGLSG